MKQFFMSTEIQLLRAIPPKQSDTRDHIDLFVVQCAGHNIDPKREFRISHFIFAYGTSKQVDSFITLEEALMAMKQLAKQYNFTLPPSL